MSERTFATARLEVVVEIPAHSSWGTDCTVDQVYRQAGEETIQKLRQILRTEFGPTAKVLGEPKVQAVITTR